MKHIKVLLAAGALLLSPIAISGAVAQSANALDALEAACIKTDSLPGDGCSFLRADSEKMLSTEQIIFLTAYLFDGKAAMAQAGSTLSEIEKLSAAYLLLALTPQDHPAPWEE